MNKIKELYKTLLFEYTNTSFDYHRKIDTDSHASLFVGINEDHIPYFMFESLEEDAGTIHNSVSSCSGFSVKYEKYETNLLRWKLTAKQLDSLELFYTVIEDIVQNYEETTNATVSTIVNRIRKWNLFFKKSDNGILELKKQVGLFGELLFLEDCLLNSERDAVNNWTGPLSKTKDFVFPGFAVEIKTTVQSDTNRIPISDENQLDPSGFEKLFLNYRQLAVDQLDGKSLPELVDEIIQLIEKQEDKSFFVDLLMCAGYSTLLSDYYTIRFIPVNSVYYNISDTFPSIIPSKLDKGIKFVNYQIELSEISKFLTNQSSVLSNIK